jgi:hypothetical protein
MFCVISLLNGRLFLIGETFSAKIWIGNLVIIILGSLGCAYLATKNENDKENKGK